MEDQALYNILWQEDQHHPFFNANSNIDSILNRNSAYENRFGSTFPEGLALHLEDLPDISNNCNRLPPLVPLEHYESLINTRRNITQLPNAGNDNLVCIDLDDDVISISSGESAPFTLSTEKQHTTCTTETIQKLQIDLYPNKSETSSCDHSRPVFLIRLKFNEYVSSQEEASQLLSKCFSRMTENSVTLYDIELSSEDNEENPQNMILHWDAAVSYDQSRPDNMQPQQTLQVYMHHICPCSNVIYPYYPPGYRPPLVPAPAYPAQNISRPYVHHYQYTQLNLGPCGVPMPTPGAIMLPQPQTSNPVPVVAGPSEVPFGPPPRDRRHLEPQETKEHENIVAGSALTAKNASSSSTDSFMASPQNIIGMSDTRLSPSTDDYIKSLEDGCILAEKIAIRNHQRPCFKNIQNLCNRARSEILKPSTTVSNIHSQGIPWAVKDFIYAYVRAINCWYILKGYMSSTDDSLGKIDSEISEDFRGCFETWEAANKALTQQLIKIFTVLDAKAHSVNSTASGQSTSVRVPAHRAKSQDCGKKTIFADFQVPSTSSFNSEPIFVDKDANSLKGKRGVIHIPQASSVERGDARNHRGESTERDEDSDNERRVYMKPGSYNVPKKSGTNANNSPRSIEFLDTAQNVSVHQLKYLESSESAVNWGKFSNTQNWLTSHFNEHAGEHERPDMDCSNVFELHNQRGVSADLRRNAAPASLKANFTQLLKNPTLIMYSVLDDLLTDLENTDFVLYTLNGSSSQQIDDEEEKYPSSLNTVRYKIDNNVYGNLNEIVHDIRLIIISAQQYFSNPIDLARLVTFGELFEDSISRIFPDIDFSNITGEAGEPIDQQSKCKIRKHPEGDGDH